MVLQELFYCMEELFAGHFAALAPHFFPILIDNKGRGALYIFGIAGIFVEVYIELNYRGSAFEKFGYLFYYRGHIFAVGTPGCEKLDENNGG